MHERIKKELHAIEERERVRIVLAVESGSRAWGFASADSDWDVRFIYVRPLDFYLSVRPGRDVLEFPIVDDLDASGWDLKKALLLLAKSNPPLFEWLRSPIVYLEEGAAGARMRSLAAEYFRPRSCLYHYLHMAEGNFRTYLKGERVRLKKYFYVLRPVLACQWIERTGGFPPMEFQKLVEAELKDDSLRQIVLDLLERKRRGDELDEGPALPELNLYLGGRIAYHQDRLSSLARVETPPLARLDGLFRASVAEAFPFGVSGA